MLMAAASWWRGQRMLLPVFDQKLGLRADTDDVIEETDVIEAAERRADILFK